MIMKVRVLGKLWGFVRKRMEHVDGQCDNPTTPNKCIYVDSRLTGERELEVIIHELRHAGDWHRAEEAVDEESRDLARTLWRLGYRKQ